MSQTLQLLQLHKHRQSIQKCLGLDLWKIYFHSVRVHSQSQSKGTGNNVDHFTLLRHQKVEAALPKYLSRDVFDVEGEGTTALPAPFYSAMYVISKKF